MSILRVSLPPVVTGPLPDPPRKDGRPGDKPDAEPTPEGQATPPTPAKPQGQGTQARGARRRPSWLGGPGIAIA